METNAVRLLMLTSSKELGEVSIESIQKILKAYKVLEGYTFKSKVYPKATFIDVNTQLYEFMFNQLKLDCGVAEAEAYQFQISDENAIVLMMDCKSFAISLKEFRDSVSKSRDKMLQDINLLTDSLLYIEELIVEVADPILEQE